MTQRVALIVGSTLAAAVIAAPLAWVAVWLGSRPVASNAICIIQLRLTLPAMLAAFCSAWWHSRKGRAIHCPQGILSARIVWWSFPVLAAIAALVMSMELALFAKMSATSASDLMLSAASLFVIVMLASNLLFLPAFFLECAVVRLVRARYVRVVSSGVFP